MIRPGSATEVRLLAATSLSRRTRLLWREFNAAAETAKDPRARQWRDKVGWPPLACRLGLGGAVARITPDGDRTYRPAELGEESHAAIVMPVWTTAAPGTVGELLDLAAWAPGKPLLTRLGLGVALGEWLAIDVVSVFEPGQRIWVFDEPLEWARRATWETPEPGIVPLDWGRLREVLAPAIGKVAFVTTTVATGQRLRAALKPPKPITPEILVEAPDRGASAA